MWRACWVVRPRCATANRAGRWLRSACRWRQSACLKSLRQPGRRRALRPTRKGRAMAPERQLLIVEDDAAFARALGRSFERRGYQVNFATSLDQVEAILQTITPTHAVVDLKLNENSSGLQ